MIRSAVDAVMKQPLIIVIISIVMLILVMFNMFIPVMATVVGIVNMTKGGFFDSVLAVMQILIEPRTVLIVLISLLLFTCIISVVIGLLLPGYLLIVNEGLSKKTTGRRLLTKGIKKYFLKFFLISLKSTLFTTALAVIILVSSVPAIVITRVAFLSRPNLMPVAIFIDLLTVFVIIFCLSFYSTYTYMWYIASLTASKKPFLTGKAIADRCFWKIAMGLLLFDVVFVLGIFAVYMIDIQLLRYIMGWIFTTCFFTTLAVFLMKNFRDSSRISIITE